jgi:hypothetical protein
MSKESIYAIIEKHELQISYMAQRYPVLAKHYYRRWFLGLTLCPGYRFFHEKKRVSKYKRFNTTASYFNFEEVLELGFDDWWDQNQIKLQSAIPTNYLENIHLSYSLTSKEIERQLAQKKAEYENNLSEEDLQLDNLTIIDSSSGIDHKEIDYIDKLISTRIIKFIKEMSDGNIEFFNKSEYQKLKQKNIYDLIEPSNPESLKANSINSLENRVSEWNGDFYRIFWYAQLGYFYYDSDTNGKVGKAKERKYLESKTPNFIGKGDSNSQHVNLFDAELKEEFLNYINPSKKEFFSIEKLIKIISVFCPETLDYSKRNLIDQLPSIQKSSVILSSETAKTTKSKTLIKFSDDNNFYSYANCDMWDEIKSQLEDLFSNEMKLKLAAAYKIAEIFIEHTESTDTVDSINLVKLKIIASVLPFLFQEGKNSGRKKYGSLTLLWKERPNLFIETENMFFGTTILIRNNIATQHNKGPANH